MCVGLGSFSRSSLIVLRTRGRRVASYIKYQSEAFKQGGQKASVVQSELEKRYQVVHKQIGNVFDEVSLI